jgi:hypothetical protein
MLRGLTSVKRKLLGLSFLFRQEKRDKKYQMTGEREERKEET